MVITKFRISRRMDESFAQRTTEPFYVLAFCSFFGLALLFSNYVNILLLGGCVQFSSITNIWVWTPCLMHRCVISTMFGSCFSFFWKLLSFIYYIFIWMQVWSLEKEDTPDSFSSRVFFIIISFFFLIFYSLFGFFFFVIFFS